MTFIAQSFNKIATGIYEYQGASGTYKFNINGDGFGYYVNNVYAGSLNNTGAALQESDVTSIYPINVAFTLTAHQGYFVFKTSTNGNSATIDAQADGLFYGEPFPLVSGSNPAPTPAPSDSIDMSSGFGEKDLTTNIINYFAKTFKFKNDDIEWTQDEEGNVTGKIKQSVLDSVEVDLTNITNTSLTTDTLTATTSQLGDATVNSLQSTTSSIGEATAEKIEVGQGGLTFEDAEGHKHQFVVN